MFYQESDFSKKSWAARSHTFISPVLPWSALSFSPCQGTLFPSSLLARRSIVHTMYIGSPALIDSVRQTVVKSWTFYFCTSHHQKNAVSGNLVFHQFRDPRRKRALFGTKAPFSSWLMRCTPLVVLEQVVSQTHCNWIRIHVYVVLCFALTFL